MMRFLQPGGADEDRDARADRRVEVGVERERGREVGQHVAVVGQQSDVAALVDPAGDIMSRRGDRAHESMAHAPLATDDADPRHCLSR